MAEDGDRIDVNWPPGYRASFVPGLVILDEQEESVLEAGDFVDGACEVGDASGLLMSPPFLALRLECGPIPMEACGTGWIRLVATQFGWPDTRIDSVTALDANGNFLIRLEDGTEQRGNQPLP